MNLKTYLSVSSLTFERFASLIGVSSARTVQRYASGERTPSKNIMARIALATNGQVTANDFYEPEDKAGARR